MSTNVDSTAEPMKRRTEGFAPALLRATTFFPFPRVSPLFYRVTSSALPTSHASRAGGSRAAHRSRKNDLQERSLVRRRKLELPHLAAIQQLSGRDEEEDGSAIRNWR